MKHLNGIPTKKKLEKLGFNTDMIEVINSNKQEITFMLIENKIKPIPEVTKVIKELKRNDIPFAVCSNSIRKSIELFLKAANITGEEFIISNQEVINPKPNPEMYLKAIERLGLPKDEVLIVEDSPVGIEAAKASGANLCIVKDPYDIHKVIVELNKYNKK
jgi:HAD superfamily hydrolase (TIGR01509 family)